MAGDSRLRPLPDALLERYLADDLSDEKRREVERILAGSQEAQERLVFLKKGREEFLLADPPAHFAHRLVAKLELEEVMQEGARKPFFGRWLNVVALPSLAIATIGIVAITVSDKWGDSSPLDEAVLQESLLSRDTAMEDSIPKKKMDFSAERSVNHPAVVEKKLVPEKVAKEGSSQERGEQIGAPESLPQAQVRKAKKREPRPRTSSNVGPKKITREAAEQRESIAVRELGSQERKFDADAVGEPASSGKALGLKQGVPGAGATFGLKAKTMLGSSFKMAPLGRRQAQSRRTKDGVEIRFLVSGDYHCMIVGVEGDSIAGVGSTQSQECKTGLVRWVVANDKIGTGFWGTAYVIVASHSFALSDVEHSHEAPRVKENWVGTLEIVHQEKAVK